MRIFSIIFVLVTIFISFSGITFASDSKNSVDVKKSKNKKWTHGSIIISKEESHWIAEAIKSYSQKIPIEILLPDLFPSNNVVIKNDTIKKEEKKEIEENITSIVREVIKKIAPDFAPAFYLKSILYFSPTNWSIWLNDKKISDKNSYEHDHLDIMKITGDKVILLWQNSNISMIYPKWQNNFIALGDNKFTSHDKNIVVDGATGNISFILRPNQSFVSKSLEIVEGVVEGSKLNVKQDDMATDNKKRMLHNSDLFAPSNKKGYDPSDSKNPAEKALQNLQSIEALKALIN